MADNVLIHFVGDTSGLTPAEDALLQLAKSGDEVAQKWAKSAAKMNAENKKNTEGVSKLAKSIDNLAIASKSMDKAAIGGAYKDYLKQIQQQLGLTSKELITYLQNARKAAQENVFNAATNEEAQAFSDSIHLINDQLKAMGAWEDEVSEKTNSLRARIRMAKEELVAMAEAGKQNTPEFKALQKQAGELDDQMRDLNATVKGLGSDTKHIDGLISLTSGLAGGFAVAQGAAALFGDENEEVQKALLKVNAAMSILQGLQAIQNVLQKESAGMLLVQEVRTSGLAVATQAQAAATAEATVAQRALNVAQAASPIGAALLVITTLVGAMALLSKESSTLTEQQKRQNEVNEKAVDGYVEEATQLQLLQSRVKQAGLSIEEKKQIVIDYNKQFGDSIGKAKDFADAENKIINLGPKYIDMLKAQAKEHAAFELAVEANKDALIAKQKSDEDYLKWYDKVALNTFGLIDSEQGRKNFISNTGGVNRQNEIKEKEAKANAFLKIGEEEHNASLKLLEQYNFKDKEETDKANQQKTKSATDTANKLLEIEKKRLEDLKALKQTELSQLVLDGKKETQAYITKQNELTNINRDIQLVGVKSQAQIANIKIDADLEIHERNKAFTLKAAEEILQLNITALRTNAEINKNAGDELLVTKKKLLDAEYKQQVKHINDTVSNEYVKNSMLLIAFAKLLSDKKELDAQNERSKIDYSAEIAALENNAAIIKKRRELIGVTDKQLINKINGEILDLQKKGIEAEIALNEKLHDKKLIKEEDYAKKKLELANKLSEAENQVLSQSVDTAITITQQKVSASEKILQAAVSSFKMLFSGLGADDLFSQIVIGITDTVAGVTKTLNALELKITEINASGLSEADKFTEIQKAKLESFGEVVAAIVGQVQQAVNAIYQQEAQARQTALNNRIADLEAQKERELANENLSQQQRADIEEKYRQKEKQEKLKTFLADKEAKKTQAIINGALAITATFAQLGFIAGWPFALAQAAITAVQIAKINSAPIPRFKKGKEKGYYEGLGIVDDGGKIEPILRKDGTIEIAQGKPKERLTYLHRDDMVFPSMQSMYKHFQMPVLPDYVQTFSDNGQAIDYDKLANKIAEKMAGVIPAPAQIHNTFEGGEVKKFVLTAAGKTEIKNTHFDMNT